jgi:hypothetical protein
VSFRHIYIDALFAAALLYVLALGTANAFHPRGAGWGHDELLHLQFHFTYKNHLKSNFEITPDLLGPSLRKPVLPYAFSTLVSFAYPAGQTAALLANLIWVGLWLWMLYRAGRELAGPVVSFAAVGLLTQPSEFWGIVGHFGNEAPACFWTAAILFFLSNGLRFRRFWTWPILGAMLALGLLSKPTVGLFVGPGILLVFLTRIFLAGKARQWATLARIVAGAAVAAPVAVIVYAHGYPLSLLLRLFGEFGQQVAAEATTQAKPFYSFFGATLWSDWHRVFGHQFFALLVVGAALAPFTLRGPGARPWLIGFYCALLAFVRAPQSSSLYAYPVIIVPLWAALRPLMDKKRRPLLELLLVAFGLLMFLSQPVGFHDRPGIEKRVRPALRMAALGRLVADKIDRGNRGQTAGDLFFVDRCAPVKHHDFFFLLSRLGDSPHVQFIYYRVPLFTEFEPADDRRFLFNRRRIAYLLSCGGSGTLDDFTSALNETLVREKWLPFPASATNLWPRFAGVKPRVFTAPDDPHRQRWYLWRADQPGGASR